MGKKKTPLPEKYHYRYEQIIQYLCLAGEISTTIYKLLGISYDNYRKLISRFKQRNIIRTVRLDGLSGYTLTSYGKGVLMEDMRFVKYDGCFDVVTSDTQKRRRMQSYSNLYALFDLYGVVYEKYNLPDINQLKFNNKKLYFYNSKDFKRGEENSDAFKGSRSYGFIAGNNKIYPIYIGNKKLPQYTNREFGYIAQLRIKYNSLSKFEHCVLLSYDIDGVSQMLKDFINFEENGKGKSLTESGYYDDVIIIPMVRYFKLNFWCLYNEIEIRKSIISQLKIVNKESYIINDGFINDNEPVIFLINIAAAKLKLFLSLNRKSKIKGHIICFDYMCDTIRDLLKNDNNINIIKIDSAAIESSIGSI